MGAARVLILLLILLSADAVHAADVGSRSSSQGDEDDAAHVWSAETETLTCCAGGEPQVHGAYRNLSVAELPSSTTERRRAADGCRDFRLEYVARRRRVLSDEPVEDELDETPRVACKCPARVDGRADAVDASCRRVPPCRNGGIRTFNQQCICPTPFFGDACQKYCDQGQRLQGKNGREYCSCVPYYQGEECRDLLCLNGGREDNGRCICPHQFLGYHCEIDTNRTGAMSGSRFQRFGDQGTDMFTRDISGTIFSLIMIVVLVVSMYLLMKHRMQSRFLNRRNDLLGACSVPMPTAMVMGPGQGPPGCLRGRTGEYVMTEDPRIYSFRPIMAMPDTGPPPYMPVNHRGRRGRGETLPPLPSYEDATKLPPLRGNLANDGGSEADDEASNPAGPDSRAGRSPTPEAPAAPPAPPAAPAPIRATVVGNEMIRVNPRPSPSTTGTAGTPAPAGTPSPPSEEPAADAASVSSMTGSVSSTSSASAKSAD